MKTVNCLKKRITINCCIAGVILFVLLFAAQVIRPAEVEAASKVEKTYANVVVFAYFKDGNTDDDYYVENPNQNTSSAYYLSLKDDAFYRDEKVKNAFLKMYNGDESYSMKNYMNKVSDGQFEVVNIFPQLKNDAITPYCIQETSLADAKTGNKDAEVISEIMQNVSLPSGVTVDYDGDGCVDNLTVILRGGGKGVGSTGGKGAPTLYSHKADLGAVKWSDGKAVNAYNMLNTYSIMESVVGSESGVLIHEFMHTLGFPDLYPQDGAEEPYPVYTWDAMATSARYQSYPLAYMRMKIGGWIDESDIPVITTSQTKLTLDKQDVADGTRAYIIKSPLNDEQFFVVEFRKKPASAGLDYYIGGDGIIVYRIDPSVDELSNHGGQTAVYVFRPQSGNGYDASNAVTTVQSAYLSEEIGRTEMGTKDMDKKLKDGAITFSNGDNSGIVISNVSSAKGDQITFDVEVPSASDYDVWTDTKFQDGTDSENMNKMVAIRSWNDTPYMAVYRNGEISLWKYADDAWKQVGTAIKSTYISSLNLEVYNGELYLSYDDNGSTINVKKMSKGTTSWTNSGTTQGSGHSLQAMSDGLYMAYLKPDSSGFNSDAILAKVAGGAITDLKVYDSGFFGTPDIAQASGKIYVSVRDSSNNVHIYKYEDGQVNEVSQSNLKSNTYDLVGNGDKIYVILGGSNEELKLYTYDGSNWETINSGMQCFQPKFSVSQGNVYILMTPGAEGSIKVVRYDEETKSFVEEGINIDGAPSAIDFTAIEHKLFVGYVRSSDNKIYVKLKESTAPDAGGEGGSGGSSGGDSSEQITEINPKKTKLVKLTAGKKKFTATWKKRQTQTTGYQIRYSLKKNFAGAKTKTIKKNTTTKKVIKKLRSKKYYYVKVRTYKKAGGKNYYSAWSTAKRVKVK